MPDFILKEENRKKLDGIISQMVANKESDSDIQLLVDDFKSKYGEKKNPAENASPIGTQTSKRGFEPFQSPVDTKTPSVLLSDEQKLQREQDRIAKRFETTLLNIPTEFGKVAPAMRAAKQIQETLPEKPQFRKYGEIPTMQPTAMTEGQLLGESLTTGTDFQELTTDKLTNKKTGLQKQIENAQDAFRTVQGEDIAGQVQNYTPEEETLKIKEELGFTESVSRIGRNFVNRLQQFIPNTALALGGTLQTILGEDIGSDFYAQMTKGGDIDAQRREAFARLDELKPAMEYTKGFIESGKDFDVAGLAAAIVDATSSLLSTVITSAPTAGIGLYSDMVGGGVYDYNTTKANRLGMTVEQLYETGQNEFVVPAMLQGFAAKLEGIGLKGIKQGILANVKKGSGQGLALIAHNANREGFTEFLQTGVDAAQNALAEGKNVLQAGEIAVSKMFSKEGAESYLMGAVASGAAIGGGRILKGLVSDKSKKKASQAIQVIEQQQAELANPNLTEESRVFVLENIQNNVAELVDAVDSDVNETEGLSTEQKQEVGNLNAKMKAFEVVINDPAASEETKKRAEKLSIETQAKIDAIIKKKPPIEPPATGGAMVEKADRIAEIESILSNDDAVFTETGNRPLLKEARAELKAELDGLKKEQSVKKEAKTEVELISKPEEVIVEDVKQKKFDIERKRKKELKNITPALEGKRGMVNTNLAGTEVSGSIGEGFTDIQDIELTNEEKAEAKKQFKLNDIEFITNKELSEWKREFSKRVLQRISDEINAKYDAELKALEEAKLKVSPEQQVEQLRAEEQAEYDAMADQKDKVERQKIYDKYDKLITPLLPKKQTKPQQDATKTRKVEQSNLAEREGVTEQQQGKQEDRNNQEEPISKAEAKTSGSDSVVESREKQEVEPEFTNQEDYDTYRIDKTEDLDELAFIHQTNPTEPDYKVEGVRDYIGSKGKINAKDYARYGDANNLTPEIKRRFIDSTNKSGSLDTQAMELSELLGVEVTEENFVDFITEYSSMKEYDAKTKNKVQSRAEQRYYELTGRKLTPKRAEAGYLKIKNKPKTNEELYQSNENLQEIGISYEDIERYEDYAKQESKRIKEDLRKSESVGKTSEVDGKQDKSVQEPKSEPKLTKIEELAKKRKEAFDIAVKVRALKIDTKGKSFDATLGLPVAIWNGAVETVASAIEAGVATVDAIKRGLNYIQKNNRGQWNKKEYNDRIIKELGLRGIEVNGQDLIVQPMEDKATVELINGFYSPLEKGIAEAKTDKATGKGWMKVLSGVTEADELNYTGVKDFLESNADRPISRKELLDYMKNNRIEVVEVVLGAKEALSKEAMDDVYNGINEQLSRTNQPDEVVEFVNEKLNDWYNNPSDKNYKSLYAALGEVNLSLDDFIESAEDRMDDTKFSEYQLEGEKENYKEVLVTMPRKSNLDDISDKLFSKKYTELNASERVSVKREARSQGQVVDESNTFRSSHFDEPNILVHLRMNTRTDAEGKKVLFIEEVQSDWGQKGKREGFGIDDTKYKKRLNEINLELDAISERVGNKADQNKELLNDITTLKAEDFNAIAEKKYPDVYKELTNESILIKEKKDLENKLFQFKNIPTAPFVTDTNAWTKLGLKTALKEAVAQGADKLAWTTGEQQNDRYDLSKSVKRVDFIKVGEDRYKYEALDLNSKRIAFDDNGTTSLKDIENMFGKDIAEKVKADKKGDLRLEGEGLKVGGKGMKGFYGSPSEGSLGIVGNVAKSLFGQEPKTVGIKTGKTFDQDVINGDYTIEKKKYNGFESEEYQIITPKGKKYPGFDSVAEAKKYADSMVNTQHSIDITPELKQAVKSGLPLFKNNIVQATERRKEAKAKLDALNRNLGIAQDPKEKAKALFNYHKALVEEALAYIEAGAQDIKNKINSAKEFAEKIGLELSDAISDAWNEANGGKKKVESDFEETVKEKEVSGIKKALVSDEIIESVNLDKISDKQMLELGKKLVETGEIKPANIVLSIAKGTPRALQPKEVVALIYYKATLDNQRRELLSEYNKKVENGESVADIAIELDNVQTNIDLYDVMAVITANQQSLAFRLRKGLLDKDYNLVTQIEQYKKVNGGIIPAEVEAKFRELDKQLTELKDKLKDAEQRAIEAEEVKSVKNIVEDIERTNSTTKKGSLTPQEKARKKELAKKYNVFNDVTRIVTILAEKDFREYAKLIFKEAKGDFVEFGRELIKTVGNDIKDFLPNLYKELGGKGEANVSELTQQPFVKDGELVIPPAFIRDAVEQGNTDINALAEAVKKIVEGELPNVTIRAVRDAITRYGRTVNQTKDVVQQQINEAKRLGRLYSELEDLQNKKAKEKSGKVFNKISEKERELKRKIKILERAIPPTPEVLEQTELQRSNARKEYLKRFIQEKKDRLSKDNFAPKPKATPVRKDSEIIALETEANKIRDEYDAAHYDNEQANRSTFNKIKDTAVEWGTGVSRALVAGLDFGFFLVQGIISIGSTNPLKTLYAINQSLLAGLGTNANPITETRRYFRELGSEKVEREQLANLKAQPYYPIMKASGLSIQEPNAKLGERDDALQASVINKIWDFAMLPIKYINPKAYEVAVKANPYRAGERAYTGASNAIRVQMFLDFAIALEKKGITFEDSPELYKIAANTANNMTFRGRLRFAEPIAAQLNMLYFSSRKVTASLSLVNPAYWVDLGVRNPIVAKQALLKMATFIGVATSVTLALQAFSDDDDEEQNPDMFNPYSSDFMTYRIGNTRLNFFGGLGGNLVLFARFLTGNYKTTSSSKIKKLGQDSFTPNRKELLETTLFANKLNPMAGTGYAFLNQSIGREIDWEDEAISSVSPLWAQNISELQREHPYVMASFLSYMSFLGQSINTYGTPEFIDREKDKELFDLIQLKNASFTEKTRSNVDVLDINTGQLRGVTKDEFETFKKEYGDYVKSYLKSNIKELSKMPVEKFEREITNLKTRATKVAKEAISGITPDMLTIEDEDKDKTYQLTVEQIKEFDRLVDKAKTRRPDLTPSRKKAIMEANSELEKDMLKRKFSLSDAMEKSKKDMLKKYKGKLIEKN
jgi:hypothetical protein